MSKGGINKQIILLKLNVIKFVVIEMNFVYIQCYTNPIKKSQNYNTIKPPNKTCSKEVSPLLCLHFGHPSHSHS